MACHGFICRTAKNAADATMADVGFVLYSNPLSTRPLHNHSSKRGAKTETDIRVTQTGMFFSMLSMCSSSHVGMSGRRRFMGSAIYAAATVAKMLVSMKMHHVFLPNPPLSRGISSVEYSLSLLFNEAKSSGGKNITGYEMSIPNSSANSFPKINPSPAVVALPRRAPSPNKRSSAIMPLNPG